MVFLAQALGILIAIFGLALFISPQLSQKVFAFFKEGKRIYIAGGVRVFAAAVLGLAASESYLPVAAYTLAVIFLLSGIIVFVCDLEKLKSFILKYSEMPAIAIRLFGLVAAAFGFLTFSLF